MPFIVLAAVFARDTEPGSQGTRENREVCNRYCRNGIGRGSYYTYYVQYPMTMEPQNPLSMSRPRSLSLSTAKRLITCQNAKCIEQDRKHNTRPHPNPESSFPLSSTPLNSREPNWTTSYGIRNASWAAASSSALYFIDKARASCVLASFVLASLRSAPKFPYYEWTCKNNLITNAEHRPEHTPPPNTHLQKHKIHLWGESPPFLPLKAAPLGFQGISGEKRGSHSLATAIKLCLPRYLFQNKPVFYFLSKINKPRWHFFHQRWSFLS